MALTDEDKEWLTELLGKQKQSIDARFAEQDQKIERVETALLTAFHQWASPVEMRQRTHSAALRAVDLEMEALTDRMAKLERPHQQ